MVIIKHVRKNALAFLTVLILSMGIAISAQEIPATKGQGRPPDDTFFLLDVSGSMMKPKEAPIFSEVKERLINDIQSRRVGDYISLHIFGLDKPRLVDQRVLQSESDKQAIIQKIKELTAEDRWTFLDVAMLAVFNEALTWLDDHPDNNIDMRIYTDGANNGPDLTDEIKGRMNLEDPDIPDNLKIYFLQYIHPDASPEEKRAQQKGAERSETLGHTQTPINTVFARIDWGRMDFGNMRSGGFEQPITLVFYYDRVLEKKLIDIRPELESVSGARPVVNIQPRPIPMTTEAIRGSFRVENVDEIDDSETVDFSGKIRFVMQDTNLPVQFQPEAISFKGRIAPLRKYTISLISDPVPPPTIPVLKDAVISVGLSNQSIIHTDRGLAEPAYFRIEITDSRNSRPDDAFKIKIAPAGGANIDERVAGFVEAREDKAKGTRIASLKEKQAALLRIWYSQEYLSSIRRPGYYPFELTVETDDPDLAADISIPEAITESGEAAGTRRAEMVRFFPGRLPSFDEFVAFEADPASWDSKAARGGIITPPPSQSRKALIILGTALLIGALLHFVCFVSWGVSAVATLIFYFITWIYGGWSGSFILPMSTLGWIVWGVFAFLCFLCIMSPSCFALTPWGAKGWSLAGSSSPQLWPRARKIRKKSLFSWPIVDKISLKVGGGPGNDITEANFHGQKFILLSSAKKWNIFQGNKIRIQARAQGISVNGEELGVGRARPIKKGDKIFVEGKTYRIDRG